MDTGISKRKQAYALQYMAWKEAGNLPKSRDVALAEMVDAYSRLGIRNNLNPAKLTAGKSRFLDGEETGIGDGLGFAYWDVMVNNARALDYDQDRNWFAGLLAQAHTVLTLYTRVPVVIGPGSSIEVSQTMFTPLNGAVLVSSMTKAELELMADRFVQRSAMEMERWRTLGANNQLIRRTLNRLEKELLAEEAVKAAPAPKLVRRKPVKRVVPVKKPRGVAA